MFWVIRPRLETRLRNSAVDSSAGRPARSSAPDRAEEQREDDHAGEQEASVNQRLLSAARMPRTTKMRPSDDITAPPMSNGRPGSAGSGSRTVRRSSKIVATTSVWKTNAARQLIVEAIRPPISGPVAAPIPPIALIVPNARALEVIR